MSGSGKIRLFVAATVPEDRLRALSADTAELRSALAQGRWTEVENQHVTLKFLGSVPEVRLAAIQEVGRTAAASHQVATVSLAGLGAFPNTRRARVLWAGMHDEAGVLGGIATDLDRGFEPLGFTPEARAFTPHLTLARFKTPRPLPELPALHPSTQASFPIADIVLFRSHLSPRGARYEPLDRFELRGSS